MHFVAEGTGLLGMCTFVIGKILSRALVTGKARFFHIICKMQGKRFMRVGVTGQTVFQLKMGPALVAHGTFGNNVLSPWRMLIMTIKTGNSSLVLTAVTGN
jgi:hypothetical protein